MWRGLVRTVLIAAVLVSAAAARAQLREGTILPVDLELLLDWLRGVLNSAGPNVRQPVIEVGPLRIDTQSLRVWMDGGPVKLTPTEYRKQHGINRD